MRKMTGHFMSDSPSFLAGCWNMSEKCPVIFLNQSVLPRFFFWNPCEKWYFWNDKMFGLCRILGFLPVLFVGFFAYVMKMRFMVEKWFCLNGSPCVISAMFCRSSEMADSRSFGLSLCQFVNRWKLFCMSWKDVAFLCFNVCYFVCFVLIWLFEVSFAMTFVCISVKKSFSLHKTQ